MAYALPPDITSPQQLESLLHELALRQTADAHASIKAQVAAGRTAGAPLAPETDEQAELVRQADELKRILKDAPRLHVTLAAMPSPGLKRELVAALRQAVDPQALVAFGFNSALGGGMVVRCGSRVFDWSYRQRLLDHSATFTGVLRRV